MAKVAAEVGSTANSYQILAKLAVGGMAEIFLARGAGVAGVERYCVLKRILRERANDAQFAQMFLDEARLAAQLQHPNIASVYDIGMLGDSYFFTMEYVHGETVRSLLQRAQGLRRPLPLACVLTIIAGTAAGLHHAHERNGNDGRPLGIVHRDISPSNLMVSYEGNVKVVDFGVAKASDRELKTRSGTVKGKISYLSPEQCRGTRVDRRSDLFSLGIVMWEMLTGARLYRRDSDFAVMSAIVHDAASPPSELRPEVPPAVDDIVARLLAKSVTDRFQTAGEVLEAVENASLRAGTMLSTSAVSRLVRDLFGLRAEPWLELDGDTVSNPRVTLASKPVPDQLARIAVDPVEAELASVVDLTSPSGSVDRSDQAWSSPDGDAAATPAASTSPRPSAPELSPAAPPARSDPAAAVTVRERRSAPAVSSATSASAEAHPAAAAVTVRERRSAPAVSSSASAEAHPAAAAPAVAIAAPPAPLSPAAFSPLHAGRPSPSAVPPPHAGQPSPAASPPGRGSIPIAVAAARSAPATTLRGAAAPPHAVVLPSTPARGSVPILSHTADSSRVPATASAAAPPQSPQSPQPPSRAPAPLHDPSVELARTSAPVSPRAEHTGGLPPESAPPSSAAGVSPAPSRTSSNLPANTWPTPAVRGKATVEHATPATPPGGLPAPEIADRAIPPFAGREPAPAAGREPVGAARAVAVESAVAALPAAATAPERLLDVVASATAAPTRPYRRRSAPVGRRVIAAFVLAAAAGGAVAWFSAAAPGDRERPPSTAVAVAQADAAADPAPPPPAAEPGAAIAPAAAPAPPSPPGPGAANAPAGSGSERIDADAPVGGAPIDGAVAQPPGAAAGDAPPEPARKSPRPAKSPRGRGDPVAPRRPAAGTAPAAAPPSDPASPSDSVAAQPPARTTEQPTAARLNELFNKGDHATVVRLCSEAVVTTEIANACVLAACYLQASDKVTSWLSAVAKERREAMVSRCNQLRATTRASPGGGGATPAGGSAAGAAPATGSAGDCARDPRECR